MMKKLLMLMTLILLICVMVFLGWYATKETIVFLQSLDSDLATAFVASAAVIIGSTITISLGKAFETRSAIQAELRSKKTPVYETIVSTLYKVMFSAKTGKKISDNEILKLFAQITEQITIWGSDDVLLAWSNFRTAGLENNPNSIIFEFENLLLAIRKDLGHKNIGIGKTDLLKLFLNDVEGIMSKLPNRSDE